MRNSVNVTPEGTSVISLGLYDVQVVKIGPPVRAGREPKQKVKRNVD